MDYVIKQAHGLCIVFAKERIVRHLLEIQKKRGRVLDGQKHKSLAWKIHTFKIYNRENARYVSLDGICCSFRKKNCMRWVRDKFLAVMGVCYLPFIAK